MGCIEANEGVEMWWKPWCKENLLNSNKESSKSGNAMLLDIKGWQGVGQVMFKNHAKLSALNRLGNAHIQGSGTVTVCKCLSMDSTYSVFSRNGSSILYITFTNGSRALLLHVSECSNCTELVTKEKMWTWIGIFHPLSCNAEKISLNFPWNILLHYYHITTKASFNIPQKYWIFQT